MTTYPLHIETAHPSWQPIIKKALAKMDADYLHKLQTSTTWLPGSQKIFTAFSQPVNKVQYVLFGESPYPRAASANGFAFWDAAVTNLWSDTGLSKQVNRATSLRNIIKMLLIADKKLKPHATTQQDIANLDKTHLVQTNNELFQHLLNHGFLLLNTTLVLADAPRKDALAWQPFMQEILTHLLHAQPQVSFILFGGIAKTIDDILAGHQVKKIITEHPYNVSFITNPTAIQFFAPMHLLAKKRETVFQD